MVYIQFKRPQERYWTGSRQFLFWGDVSKASSTNSVSNHSLNGPSPTSTLWVRLQTQANDTSQSPYIGEKLTVPLRWQESKVRGIKTARSGSVRGEESPGHIVLSFSSWPGFLPGSDQTDCVSQEGSQNNRKQQCCRRSASRQPQLGRAACESPLGENKLSKHHWDKISSTRSVGGVPVSWPCKALLTSSC